MCIDMGFCICERVLANAKALRRFVCSAKIAEFDPIWHLNYETNEFQSCNCFTFMGVMGITCEGGDKAGRQTTLGMG